MPNEQFGERELLSESGFHQFVPVVFADSPMEAEHYRSLLEDRDIPVVLQETLPTPDQSGLSVWDVPVLVPDELLNDASEIISSSAAPDDDDGNGYDDDDDDDYLEQDDQQDDLDEDEDDDYGLDEDFDDDEDADAYEDEEDLFDQDETDYE